MKLKGINKMLHYLPEIKKVLSVIFTKTNDLEKLNKKVNELIVDEIMRDCTLHRYHKEETNRYFIYEVKEDDFNHITDHINLIQTILLPDMYVMAQSSNNEFRVMIKKG